MSRETSRETIGDAGRLTGPRQVLRVLRGHRRWIAGAVGLTLVASALGLAQPLVVRRVVESSGAGSGIVGSVGLLITLFLAQALVQAVAGYVLARTGEGVVLGIRLNLIDRLLRKSRTPRPCAASPRRRRAAPAHRFWSSGTCGSDTTRAGRCCAAFPFRCRSAAMSP
ncbi:hypothetical protein [Streptomyces sp. ISL-96]|uniref:hypothetical protein n=1 Tax=Streptomyces sp. ISL-96 TaxID=2819191 RepID=UPI00203657D8|nr:hypothetical protein [Streptomyces sp. ISL-96]